MMPETKNVERILHFKFRATGTDTDQLVALLKSAMPFYEASGTRARLLRNADDPNQFIQELTYNVPAMIETNRQAILSDPMIQGYLRTWRTLIPGGVEIDVYEDVTE
jgi:hypothetical protein